MEHLLDAYGFLGFTAAFSIHVIIMFLHVSMKLCYTVGSRIKSGTQVHYVGVFVQMEVLDI